MTIRLGTSSWAFPDWKGPFFPNSRTDELACYARCFDTVEIDSTWYATPSARVVDSWRKRVPDGFRFAAKVPREITHERGLVDCAGEFNEFLHAMSGLGDRRGPLLFQFPPHWNDENAGALREFLKLLPSDWQFAFEFRNRSWFRDEYARMLREAGVAWVLADIGHFLTGRVCPPLYVTAPFTYIRWLGDRNQPLEPFNALKVNRDAEEARWMETINSLPVEEVWGYFNNHWGGFSPGSVNLFKTKLGQPIREFPSHPNAERAAPGDQGVLF